MLDITTLKTGSLHGNVKSLKEFINSELKHASTYNDEGFEVERRFYKNNILNMRWELRFNESGYEVIQQDFDGSGKMVSEKARWQFDSKRNLINESDYIFYEYDEKGNILGEKVLAEDGSLEEEYFFKYSEVGILREKTCKYTFSGNTPFTSKWEYDDKGRLVSWEDGTTNNTYIYSYNKGQLVRELKVDTYDSEILEEDIYEYDAAGNKKCWTHYDQKWGSNFIERYLYKVDSSGRIYEKVTKGENGVILKTLSLVYDNFDNVIEKRKTGIGYSQMDKSSTTVYEIQYY